MSDTETRQKWDKLAKNFDVMVSKGAEQRWFPYKQALFSEMQGKVLFLAMGTGLDIAAFPPRQTIHAIDISPEMLKQAQPRIDAYDGQIEAQVMDVHELTFEDDHFDQVVTSCTFCSVPNPVAGLESLRRVLKPGGKLLMFEHTGSRYFPLNLSMALMSKLSERAGPSMNRPTVANVIKAGFIVDEVEHVFLDVVKIIRAHKPENAA